MREESPATGLLAKTANHLLRPSAARIGRGRWPFQEALFANLDLLFEANYLQSQKENIDMTHLSRRFDELPDSYFPGQCLFLSLALLPARWRDALPQDDIWRKARYFLIAERDGVWARVVPLSSKHWNGANLPIERHERHGIDHFRLPNCHVVPQPEWLLASDLAACRIEDLARGQRVCRITPPALQRVLRWLGLGDEAALARRHPTPTTPVSARRMSVPSSRRPR